MTGETTDQGEETTTTTTTRTTAMTMIMQDRLQERSNKKITMTSSGLDVIRLLTDRLRLLLLLLLLLLLAFFSHGTELEQRQEETQRLLE